MAIAAVEQLLSYRDGELALDALPAEARARIDEVHAGASFEIGSRTAFQKGYQFKYRATDIRGVFTSDELPNEARSGETMHLFWDDTARQWVASCGPPLGPPRQLCFRTQHPNIFDGSWIIWDCNRLAKPSNDDSTAVDWAGGTVCCRIR